MKHIVLAGLFSLFAGLLSAQFTMDQSLTVDEYVNDILLGSGVIATNVTYSGDPLQLGYLEAGDPGNFPMTGGLVLHTGDAMESIIGGAPTFITGGMGNDQDLLDIANSVPPLIGQSFSVASTWDECIIEFDFIATGDSINFNYSFGSIEWTTYINSQYNDVFAFLLSGPGITGPYDSPAAFPNGAVNIAGVPDSDPNLPITISSIHNGNPDGSDCMNCEYYNYNVPSEDIQTNAYTDLFTASNPVICGETYHIKLAIADCSDGGLSSMVVLEEGSFSSNAVVQVDLSIDVGGPEANTIYEDCGIAVLSFTRPIETILEIQEMVFIVYGGTATEGVDYNNLPDTIIFEPFVETVSFEIDAIIDGLPEGIETVQMEILNLAACNGGGLTSYFEFFIADIPDPLVVEGYDQTICSGVVTTLEPIITGGYGNFIYDWSTTEDTPTIDVSPLASTSYNLIVADTCGMPSDDADFLVNVLIIDPLEVTIDQGDFTIDCGGNQDLTATVTGGDGFYTNWNWYTDSGQNLWGWQNTASYGAWTGADQVLVDVTDGCGLTATDSVEISMNVPELILNGEDFTVFCNEDFTVDPMVEGGQSPYNFQWTINGVLDWYIWEETYSTSTEEAMTFSIDVFDNCGQSEQVEIEVSVISPEIVITMPEPITGTCVDEFEVEPEVSGGSGGFTFNWSDQGINIGGLLPVSYVPVVSTTIQLDVEDQCGGIASETIDLIVENPPLLINIGEDIDASCIDQNLIFSEILSGTGDLEYDWIVNEETVGSDATLEYQSYETVGIQLNAIDECGQEDSDDLILNIPNIPLEIMTSPDIDICQFIETEILVSASGGEGGFVYDWEILSGSDTTQIIAPGETTQYNVTATDICGDEITGSIQVVVHPVDAGYSLVYLDESTVQFDSNVAPDCDECEYDYYWDFGDGDFSIEENPNHDYDGLSFYDGTLYVTNFLGCVDSVSFEYFPPVTLYVPNTFTPNNDGINDMWSFTGEGIEKFEIIVFNRWGEVVYQSVDIDESWKGDTKGNSEYYAMNNTYTYLIKLKGFHTDAYEKTGFVNVFR